MIVAPAFSVPMYFVFTAAEIKNFSKSSYINIRLTDLFLDLNLAESAISLASCAGDPIRLKT
jgi:hypothetical protein